MNQKSNSNKTNYNPKVKDTLEKIRETPPSTTGFFDQFFGNYDRNFGQKYETGWERKPAVASPKKEFKLFNYQEYYERELIKKQIKELTELIKKEIEFIKKANASLLQEVSDISKLTVEQLPEKPGIYHVRFLEIVLNILKALRAKVSESKTWLQALISKKKKRGSLFLVRSKKQGTQYSLSQELQLTRSIQ